MIIKSYIHLIKIDLFCANVTLTSKYSKHIGCSKWFWRQGCWDLYSCSEMNNSEAYVSLQKPEPELADRWKQPPWFTHRHGVPGDVTQVMKTALFSVAFSLWHWCENSFPLAGRVETVSPLFLFSFHSRDFDIYWFIVPMLGAEKGCRATRLLLGVLLSGIQITI